MFNSSLCDLEAWSIERGEEKHQAMSRGGNSNALDKHPPTVHVTLRGASALEQAQLRGRQDSRDGSETEELIPGPQS